MIYSVFTFNGENDMLKLHLSILDNYVDRFIIVEANKTFTGNDKPLYFFRDQRYFKQWWKKIEYYPMTDWDDVALWQQAMISPQTQGAQHWKREFYIKESIHKALHKSNVQDSDMLFIGDVDEIIDPDASIEFNTPTKAKMRVYTYHLNNRSNEAFFGTLITPYKEIKDKCLNHMRSDPSLYSQGPFLGWHFTSMGGIEQVRRKLNDSYTTETYNTFEVQQNLPVYIKENTDFLNRPFTFQVDEADWPHFLKENKSKFQHLCK